MVANLTNNKDVLRFHARAGYLQTYETLLKEINSHPGSEEVPPDQYAVEFAAVADRNLNVQCESGIRYPSLISMMNKQDMLWQPSVILHTFLYCVVSLSYLFVLVCTWYIL
jgi:hypothetical protein